MSLAQKYENQFATGSIDIETIAIEKDQDWENERTYWIFKDGSALWQSGHAIGIVNDYGLHPDHEQL
jgi:hypothetical protein